MKLRTQLLTAPVIVCAVLFLCLVGFLFVIGNYERKAHATYEATGYHQGEVASVMQRLADANVTLYRTVAIIASMSDADVQARRKDLSKTGQEVAQSVSELLSVEDGQSDAAKAFAESSKKFFSSADSAIDLATVDPNTGVAALQTADAAYKRMVDSMGKLADLVSHSSEGEITDLESALTRQQVLIAVLGLLAGTGAFAFAWVMQRRIIRDVREAAQAAEDVAQGRFDQMVQVHRSDELGQLQASLARMVEGLSSSISIVQEAASSIRQASSEIAAGNQDLSARTENTASSLQSTASSMEQLTGTVRHTVESAHSANSLVQAASDAAKRGGGVMEQVVSNMAEIDAASRKINEIIGVIDGIAFQTNILALNAAVEAARAGEQGRGFAVVAGEVRSLAQRSAEAAKEIKLLIGHSVDKVELGAGLVNQAGKTMEDIMTEVRRVEQLMADISLASQEQSTGIAQVGQAVSQLDQVTQQNAALVEEAAAAADSMKHQASRLAQVVSVFRVEATA